MNNVHAFVERQYGNSNGRNYDTPLARLAVHETDSWKGIAPSTEGVDYNPEPPIFTAKFAKCPLQEHMLAIANEDGKIALQDTNRRSQLPESERSLAGQQCHFNAVFDLEWMPGHMKFISASGDHTARLWEVRDSGGFDNVRIFNGHTRSVKTAAFRKTDSAVFATGGRDGAILIWDTRAALNVGTMPRADNCIYSGHSGGPGTPASACKRRGTAARSATPKLPANVSSSSITGLVFQDDTTLVSCGAGDGIIKVWDLRRNYTSYKKEPLPKHSIPYPGTSTFKGYTNLMVDEGGVRLYVNCMDNSIYAYNLASYAAEPIVRYTGLRNSTFYIKSSLSPDGQYLLSGSSDERAYIWNVRQSEPLVALVGHTVEVTCVAWSHAAEMRVVTCSDDARHKIWRIGPEELAADEVVTNYRGQAEQCAGYWRQARAGSRGHERAVESGGRQLRARLRPQADGTPRSVRRLVAENETTPGAAAKAAKRTFGEMADGETDGGADAAKRPHLESRARRLFSPVVASAVEAGGGGGGGGSTAAGSSVFFGGHRSLGSTNLASILEETDSSPTVATFMSTLTTTPSTPMTPNGQGNGADHTPPAVAANSFFRPSTTTKQLFVSPPFTERPSASAASVAFNSLKSPETPPNHHHHNRNAAAQPLAASVAITFCAPPPAQHLLHPHSAATCFSPTSNLPNYVINGEAPHLQLQSPKRKLKENVDWLTKIRKQKLLSTINAQLNDKLNGDAAVEGLAAAAEAAPMAVRCESPRLHTLKGGEAAVVADGGSGDRLLRAASPSTAGQTPRRRTSRSGSDAARTPSSASRQRNAEHTLLRFFSRRQTPTAATASAASATQSGGAASSEATQRTTCD